MKNTFYILIASVLMACGCGAQTGLYDWEKDGLREIADAVICYGGHSARNPYLWTPERFERPWEIKQTGEQCHFSIGHTHLSEHHHRDVVYNEIRNTLGKIEGRYPKPRRSCFYHNY